MQICSGQDVFERQAHCLPALQDIADENNRTAGIFNRRHEAIYQQMRQDTRIKAAWTEGGAMTSILRHGLDFPSILKES